MTNKRLMIPKHLPVTDEQIACFCRRWHIRKLAFFGSVLRDDFGPDSDVDILLEFAPGHTPGLNVYDLEQELSQLCGGRSVDIVNPKYIHSRLKEQILHSAENAYAQG